MCDQRIRVNWKRNTQLQRIVHYFIISRIISTAMLCTVRTLLLWDLLKRMIVEHNSHVADKPPKRMFYNSSIMPNSCRYTLKWTHAHFVCDRVYSTTEKPHILTILIHGMNSMMCDQRIRVNWKKNTQLQRIVHYFIVSRIISAAMLCTVRTLLLWDLLTRMIVELNSHVIDKLSKRMFF